MKIKTKQLLKMFTFVYLYSLHFSAQASDNEDERIESDSPAIINYNSKRVIINDSNKVEKKSRVEKTTDSSLQETEEQDDRDQNTDWITKAQEVLESYREEKKLENGNYQNSDDDIDE